MNTTTLTQVLQSLDIGAFTWKFALYNTLRGHDGLELEWNLCEMQNISIQVNRLREHLLKKPVAEKPVIPYTPFLLDKENIGAMEPGDDLIREQVSDILTNIRNGQAYTPEDFVSGVLPKSVGFAFYGEKRSENGEVQEEVLLMRRGNPFLATAQLFMEADGKVVSCDRPVLKLATAVDFLLIGGTCYLLTSSIGKDLSLEERHFAIAQKQMGRIAESEIVSNYECLEECAMKGKNVRKFIDFDRRILEHVMRLSIAEREEFLSTYGVTLDTQGRMDTTDPDQCELIVDLLCCRSCLDPLGRLSVGSNIVPRE